MAKNKKCPLTAVEVLQQLKELIPTPDKWTKGVYARDSKGTPVTATNPKACCWCLIGGVRKVVTDAYDIDFVVQTMDRYCTRSIPDWQDASDRQHSDIINFIDVVIAGETKVLT